MIKSWLIKASAPFAGTEIYYRAYTEGYPLDSHMDLYDEITEELWEKYSYLLHLEDEEYDSNEAREEAYNQALEDWDTDCNITAEEVTDEEMAEYSTDGNVESISIIYDERN